MLSLVSRACLFFDNRLCNYPLEIIREGPSMEVYNPVCDYQYIVVAHGQVFEIGPLLGNMN